MPLEPLVDAILMCSCTQGEKQLRLHHLQNMRNEARAFPQIFLESSTLRKERFTYRLRASTRLIQRMHFLL
jgi:hypothetical protein